MGKKKLLALLISILPLNALRRVFYRSIFSYDIDKKAKIGWGTIVAVSSARIGNCSIGRRNNFIGQYMLTVNSGVMIGNKNSIASGIWDFADKNNCFCLVGEGARITSNHYIDASGGFTLGKNSWIAGRNSEFWTHDPVCGESSISIGDNCYVGSAVRFCPGSGIAENTIVGLGSIVTKRFIDEKVLVAGVPARITKTRYDWKEAKRKSAM